MSLDQRFAEFAARLDLIERAIGHQTLARARLDRDRDLVRAEVEAGRLAPHGKLDRDDLIVEIVERHGLTEAARSVVQLGQLSPEIRKKLQAAGTHAYVQVAPGVTVAIVATWAPVVQSEAQETPPPGPNDGPHAAT